jgi:hypothetical protein
MIMDIKIHKTGSGQQLQLKMADTKSTHKRNVKECAVISADGKVHKISLT